MSAGTPSRGLRTQTQGQPAQSRSTDRANGSTPTSATPSRAELFEDEKERIKSSCFWKKDEDENLLESYITHIRVIEDAMYPSSPPPPDSAPQNKKPRIIIVSVRKSGRVRMHKARENANGSFSIGKTWALDELTAIQSYGGPPAADPREEQHRQWASDLGFLVTIVKPYYWHATTGREKDFFVGSLVKIYKMYTGGKLPQLIGFGQQEMVRLHNQLGTSPRPSPGPSDGASPTPSPVATAAPPSIMSRPSPVKRPLQESSNQRPSSRDQTQQLPPASRQYASQGGSTQQRPPSRDQKQPVPRPYPAPEASTIPQPPPGLDQAASPPRPYPVPPPLSTHRPSGHDHARSPGKPASQESITKRPGSRDQARPLPHPIPSQDASAQRPRSRGQDQPVPTLHPPSGLPPALSIQQPPPRPRTPESGARKPADATSNLSPPVPPQSPNRQRGNVAKQTGDALQTQTLAHKRPAGSFGDGFGPVLVPEERPDTDEVGPNTDLKSTALSRHAAPLPPNVPTSPPFLDQQPPERKRPSLQGPSHSAGQKSLGGESTDVFLTPNASPGEDDSKASAPILDRTAQDEPEPEAHLAEAEASRVAAQKEPIQTATGSAAVNPTAIESMPSAKENQAPSESNTISPPVPPMPTEPKEEEVHRPGLGPMIKKKSNKDVASAFRRAANAYNAFKPRAGGAGQRLREQNENKSNEPDGITGVVPAPSLARVAQQNNSNPSISEQIAPEVPKSQTGDAVPEVKVSDETTKQKDRLPAPKAEKSRTPSPDKAAAKAKAAEIRRQKRRSGMIKYVAALDIDPGLLEGRTADIDAVFTDHGWMGDDHQKTVDTLMADIRRDIARVEAGSWLNHLDQKDERIEAVEKMLDTAIAECDELDGLLTLYGVELSTLNDDIAYIEAQSQGLQVQTANQKLLQAELKQLLQTVSISTSDLQTLRQAQFGSPGGLEMIESTLSLLYKAMITIDPTIKAAGSTTATSGGGYSAEIGNMRALQERREGYRSESTRFMARFKRHMDSMFKFAIDEAARTQQNGFDPSGAPKLDQRAYDQIRGLLWRYSPLLLFSREIEPIEWQDATRLYIGHIKPAYQEKFREKLSGWRNSAKRPTGEELEILFTTQEKEAEGLATTARKLTVKRSQTLARSLRSSGGDGAGARLANDKSQPGKLHAYEAFTTALDEMVPIIFREQNFVVDFFHMSSLEATEFPDAVAALPPNLRSGTDLSSKKPFDPDRNMAKRVSQVMQELFSFWPGDVQGLVDWTLQMDALQGIGLLYALERKLLDLEESNQEFIVHTLQKVHDHLVNLFTRFVDEQIRAIEETKVKIKKRKGVIAFMRVFPNFSTAIENMVPLVDDKDEYEVTDMINNAYQRISRAMFESLRVIAKEGPTAMAGHGVQGQGAGDPEDKEALNYHILLIENMNHYLNEVESRDSAVLESWREQAAREMAEHMELYIDAIIRRPLGKLLDFVESTEAVISATSDPTSIASRASHSRQTFKKIVSSYDIRELRRGVEALRKRVEKHFGEADEPNLSAALVQKVLKECESRYLDVADRTRRIAETVYDGGAADIEWRKDDILNAFRR
ncbi:hypothetical protein L228DRAFT_217317 [Xylona heveae TC161]|uniref:Exocyst complex component Sec3 PIP2-binding N-terminal domain-containing protein n=1 Tax=Xylona heveae (strain CBS 132557 / TC161) TaxID=1328760 RepID=A0A165IIH8_XYLHT|nr:hypothetical protein L228DRAFT_217317 [Xylona heveae TC161]KZF24941.1 hypothetical protein L228DRAFT_217317 [Xylona heveae TC161]